MGMFVVAPSTHHLSDHHHSHNSLHPPISNSAATATALGVGVGVGVGVIPLLAGNSNNNNNNSNNNSSIQFWQTPQNYPKKPIFSDHGFGCGGGDGGSGGGGSVSTSGSTTTCQDCGNQAKKDCNHRRCRTCCKSRGFDCATHVKSTWVPAARRRERQLIITSTGGAAVAAAGSSASTSGTKKPRLTSRTTTPSHTSTSNATSSSHHQGQVRAPAVFKCVRVTAVEDGDDEYAYQASVTISGHVFKGFLYNQGVDTRDQPNVVVPNLSELHLGGGRGGGVGRNVGCSLTSPPHNPPGGYGGGLLG